MSIIHPHTTPCHRHDQLHSLARSVRLSIAAALTGPCLYLGCGTLGTLLACDASGLAACSSGGALCLLGLLLGLSGSLLLLALLDGGGACS